MSRKLTTAEAGELLEREVGNLSHLGDIRFDVRVELGRRRMPLSAVEALQPGDVIDLAKLAGEGYDVRVHDHLFALVDIVVTEDLMACRIIELVVPEGSQAAQALRESIGTEAAEERSGEGLQEVAGMVGIPGGAFTMGSQGEDSPRNECPAHTVYVSAFYIDAFPVTREDYRAFVQATGHRAPADWHDDSYPTGTGRHPVVNVSWEDAVAYAEWCGKRLPTEAEWEKAARGRDRRNYPWGDRFVDGRCNSNNAIGGTTPVDDFPLGRSPYGVWDMAGNAYEWCADYYEKDYYRRSPGADPRGPGEGEERVIRGGFYSETRPNVRTTHRSSALQRDTRENIGFRLALGAVEIAPVEEEEHGSAG